MNMRSIAAALLCVCLSNPVLAEGDAAAGSSKSAVCAGCHGADGKAIAPNYPNLAGQHAGYLAKQMTNYRDGDRVSQLMSPMAANLSDQDVLDLAAHFSAMNTIQGIAEDEGLALGENIYRGGITAAKIAACSGCHGPAGAGNPAANYPRIGGQNKAYTAEQLRFFRSTERKNDPNNMMRALTHRMTDVEIDAVSNYIAGLN